MDIKKKVGQLVKKYGTNDPFKISKALGVVIRYINLGNVYGFHARQFRVSIIHINNELPYQKQLFTCAHELGHAICHPNENTAFLKTNTFFSTDKIEQEANEFAVELLFKQEGNRVITVQEAIDIYGISEQLLYKKFYAQNRTYILYKRGDT